MRTDGERIDRLRSNADENSEDCSFVRLALCTRSRCDVINYNNIPMRGGLVVVVGVVVTVVVVVVVVVVV